MSRKEEFPFTAKAVEERNIEQTGDKDTKGNLLYKTICSVPWTQWLRRNLMIRTNESLVHSTNIGSGSPVGLDQPMMVSKRGFLILRGLQLGAPENSQATGLTFSVTQVFTSVYYLITMDRSGGYGLEVRRPGVLVLVLIKTFKGTTTLCIKFPHLSNGNMHSCPSCCPELF